MRVTYDRSADAAYVHVTDSVPRGGVARTNACDPLEVGGQIHIDFDAERQILGMEVLDASTLLPAGVWDRRRRLRRGLGSTKNPRSPGGASMRLTLDPEADAAYISLVEVRPGDAVRTVVVDDEDLSMASIHLDFDASDHLIGIELLGARRLLHPALLDEQEARELLAVVLSELERKTYDELRLIRRVFVEERAGREGTPFVVEVESFFDDRRTKRLRVRVSVSSATGGPKQYVDVWDDLLVDAPHTSD